MKKAELLKHIPEEFPQKAEAEVIKTCGTKVLMLLIPKERVAHFTWKDGWLTYHADKGYWSRQSLNWLEGYERTKLDQSATKAIEKYLGVRIYGTGSLVTYESDITWRKYKEANERKQKRIDSFMETTVPALPHGFISWAKGVIRKQKPNGRVMSLQLIQKTRTMYVERMFRVSGKKESPVITEICRGFSEKPGGTWLTWYYGEKHGAVGRTQSFWDRKNCSVVTVLPKRFFFYDRNLEELDLPKGIITSIRAISKRETDCAALINRVRESPEMEKIIKLGMYRIADDLINSFNVKDHIKRLQKLTRQQAGMLIKHNGGLKMAELLLIGTKISERNASKIAVIRSEDKWDQLIRIAQRGLNMNHVITLMEKTGGLKYELLRQYQDYLDMAETQQMDIHDEIVYRNKRWKEYHDRYVEEINRNRREMEMRRREQQVAGYGEEKFAGIKRDFRKNTDLFGWQQGSYCIVVPESYMDIMKEGRLQHHCVGASDHYMQNMSDRKTFIVFLRKSENPEIPYYTIETDGSSVLQYYAEFDRQPDKEAVKRILDMWIKEVKRRKGALQAAG